MRRIQAPRELLEAGADALGQRLTPLARDRLLDFLGLLAQWNRAGNLTAVTELRDMVIRHLLDAMAVIPYLKPTAVLDVGAGGGLPGIPLAVLCPQLELTLLDRRRKKTEFMRYAVTRLRLANVDIVCASVEDYRPRQKFDTLTARALMSVGELFTAVRHLLAAPVRVVHMKGRTPHRELAELAPQYLSRTRVEQLAVPFLDARRCAVLTDF